jgi:hypothetical protein
MIIDLIGTSPSVFTSTLEFLYSVCTVKNPITQILKTLFYALPITLTLTKTWHFSLRLEVNERCLPGNCGQKPPEAPFAE